MADTSATDLSTPAGAGVGQNQRSSHAPTSRGQLALLAALAIATTVSGRPGLGSALALLTVLATASRVVARPASVWLGFLAPLIPWLVVRDNTWLAISITATVFLATAIVAYGHATGQRLTDFELGAIGRRPPAGPSLPSWGGQLGAFGAALRGVILAIPVLGVFWVLLAWSDEVFARWVNPGAVPFGRLFLFAFLVPLALYTLTFVARQRTAARAQLRARVGAIETSIVLAAVSSLFAVFIALRVATVGDDLEDLAFRSEVRSGFFQLLWVAMLTVALVLALRYFMGAAVLPKRTRLLGMVTVFLAAVIDVLAMIRILEYVEQSFWSPLRFWSFGFGIWLLAVLALTAVRLTPLRADRAWFTAALVSSWAVFVFAMAVVNPDLRIAEHNFANPPTGEEEYIAANPLIWLSEDATPAIVKNIEVLRPLPNARYTRVRDHLCTRPEDDSWRHFHLSRSDAREAIEGLC